MRIDAERVVLAKNFIQSLDVIAESDWEFLNSNFTASEIAMYENTVRKAFENFEIDEEIEELFSYSKEYNELATLTVKVLLVSNFFDPTELEDLLELFRNYPIALPPNVFYASPEIEIIEEPEQDEIDVMSEFVYSLEANESPSISEIKTEEYYDEVHTSKKVLATILKPKGQIKAEDYSLIGLVLLVADQMKLQEKTNKALLKKLNDCYKRF